MSQAGGKPQAAGMPQAGGIPQAGGTLTHITGVLLSLIPDHVGGTEAVYRRHQRSSNCICLFADLFK